MEHEVFQSLLARNEDATLDFKREMYVFSGEKRAEFLKDIISLSNTPREGSAYLVLGVDWRPGIPANPLGLAQQMDDALLRDQLRDSEIAPVAPTFVYHQVLLSGKHLGVIELPPQQTIGPFYPTRDHGNTLLKNVLYTRDGSSNVRANLSQQRAIFQWFGQLPDRAAQSDGEQWRRLLESTDSLDDRRQYVLVADAVHEAAALTGLGKLPWLAVLDFDPASETHGLMSHVRDQLQQFRSVLMAVKGERPEVHLRRQTIWYFARGLVGRYGTEVDAVPRTWIREYGREVDGFCDHIARAVVPNPVTVVVLWHDASTAKLMTAALDSIDKALGASSSVVVITRDEKIEASVVDAGASVIGLSDRAFSDGLDHILSRRLGNRMAVALPTASGAPCPLSDEDRFWLEEELELVHADSTVEGSDRPEPFRRGETVTWRDLDLHHDCDRSLSSSVRERVRRDIEDRSTTRVNLYHPPGAGGTTVSRRVAWDLHERFPTVLINRLVPDQTAARLAKVVALTQSSVLAVVDGGHYRESELDELYSIVRSQQTPVVLLQVVRRFHRPSQSGLPSGLPQRVFWLPLELDAAEAERFRVAYSSIVPARSEVFQKLSASKDLREKTAFYFGLAAYGRDFTGLRRYISSRLADLTDAQRRALGFLAIAHHYGQQPLPAQCFVWLFSLPRDRSVDVAKLFPQSVLELLVPEGETGFRTAHNLIAEEILQQLLTTPQDSSGANWKQQLSGWAIAFAEMLRGDWQTPSEQILDLASRVFVIRDNSELLGTESSAGRRFSAVIEDVPSIHGRLGILERLVELFPHEAHFHAHLGRFRGLHERYKEALESIDRAIELSDSDHVLYHMRGMILRYQIRGEIDKDAPLDEVIRLAKDARVSFARSRELNSENEHGYISEVQLLITVLDYAGKKTKVAVTKLVYSPTVDPFLREALEVAEDLLDQVQVHRGGDRPSEYQLDCRAKLDALYGDYSSALQGWNSLLERQDSHKPPVRRQIVWTLLHRNDGDWSKMRTKDIDRSIALLQENLTERADDNSSLRLWLRAVRHAAQRPSLNSLIEKVVYWKSNSGSLEATFYLFVLHALAAIEGSVVARDDAQRALDECKYLARFRRDRTRSFEWVGKGDGIARLIHQSSLGEWAGDFYDRIDLLVRMPGRVAQLSAPQKGLIELECGLDAFFVPTVAGLQLGRDENRRIDAYVGFSYDGLRAWQVQPVS